MIDKEKLLEMSDKLNAICAKKYIDYVGIYDLAEELRNIALGDEAEAIPVDVDEIIANLEKVDVVVESIVRGNAYILLRNNIVNGEATRELYLEKETSKALKRIMKAWYIFFYLLKMNSDCKKCFSKDFNVFFSKEFSIIAAPFSKMEEAVCEIFARALILPKKAMYEQFETVDKNFGAFRGEEVNQIMYDYMFVDFEVTQAYAVLGWNEIILCDTLKKQV